MSDTQEKEKQKLEQLNAEKEKLLTEFLEKNTKKIEFNGLSPELKICFEKITQDLKAFREEITSVKEKFMIQANLLQEKLRELESCKKISLDKNLIPKHEAAIKNYEKFLSHLCAKVDNELNFCEPLISENPPSTLTILNWDVGNTDEILQHRLKSIKSMIKTNRKDLRVSFSKYDFSFGSQIKYLEQLDLYLKRLEQTKPSKLKS